MAYNFNKKLEVPGFTVEVDTAAAYGYFEHDHLGDSCGGGLWFEVHSSSTPGDAGRVLELTDYDGVAELPKAVKAGLIAAGIIVGLEF